MNLHSGAPKKKKFAGIIKKAPPATPALAQCRIEIVYQEGMQITTRAKTLHGKILVKFESSHSQTTTYYKTIQQL